MTRAEIRAGLATLLEAKSQFDYTDPAGTAGHNVFKARMNSIPRARMPAACIFFDDEDIEAGRKGTNGRRLDRRAKFFVEVLSEAATEEALETSLDTLSGVVEVALTVDNDLGGDCKAIELKNVAYDRDLDPEAERPNGAALLTFEIWYESTEGA